MKKRGKGKKMDQAADNQGRTGPGRGSLPRDQPRRTIPRTESADNTSPRNRTRELEVGVVGRGRVLRTKAVRGFSPKRSSFDGTDRGPRPRVGAVCGRCKDQLTHLLFGSNPGLLGRPVRVLSYY
ncbi:hypothetical protein F2Q69_00003553 [Brassica cretica]|uniref:Uncharacterized protein n=1 Tax=Brassica cretica TaxID=69181 RepID=A0A8S9PF11_BRACR|nr:hypothetical protein F2Q69_00003553 [Brassica cretica]